MKEYCDISRVGSAYEERIEVNGNGRQHRLRGRPISRGVFDVPQPDYPWEDGPAPDAAPLDSDRHVRPGSLEDCKQRFPNAPLYEPREVAFKQAQSDVITGKRQSHLHDLIVEDMALTLARGIYANQALRVARFTGQPVRTWDELAPGQQAMAIEDAHAGLATVLVKHRMAGE